MLIEIYILLSIYAFIIFFISFTKEPRVFFSAASMVLFFSLAIASTNMEKMFCESGQTCYTYSYADFALMAFNVGFAAISLIYLLLYALGYAVKMAEKEV